MTRGMCFKPHPYREMDMRGILAWAVKCSLLIFIIVGFILMPERLRIGVAVAGVCSIRVLCVIGYIDKRIELDLHTEDTVYLGVIKTSVIIIMYLL